MDNQDLRHTQDTTTVCRCDEVAYYGVQERRHRTQDTTTVCRCDEVAYYGVQERRHRGFILGPAPELPRASHRASETPTLHRDDSTSWSQQSTKLGVGERITANYMLKSRGEVW